MHITHLTLQNFRGFEQASFSFSSGAHCVWGENGAGKSNLLEAIFFAATGRPSRAGREAELIRFGENVARVELHVRKQGRHLILEGALERLENTLARKTLRLNRQPLKRLSELLGEVKVVLFTPQDELMIHGEPSLRRRFLDFLLSQISSRYLHALQEYQSVREQRNSLLKRPHGRLELHPWNDQLVKSGAQVLTGRLEILPRLARPASAILEILSGGTEQMFLSYQASFPIPPAPDADGLTAAFRQALEKTADEEAQRGMTLVGPHRDDLAVFLGDEENQIDARLYASQGEQKSAALALKLAEGKLFEEEDGETPIYLLDDCFSELDPLRQEAIHPVLNAEAQSILTFTLPPPAALASAPVIKLERPLVKKEPAWNP